MIDLNILEDITIIMEEIKIRLKLHHIKLFKIIYFFSLNNNFKIK